MNIGVGEALLISLCGFVTVFLLLLFLIVVIKIVSAVVMAIEGKNKAGLSLMDIEKVVEVLGNKGAFYSVHINSANDILVKKDSETKLTDADSKHRRLASEKSMSVLSNKDLSQTKKSKGKPKNKPNRTESKKLNVNDYSLD